MYDSLFKIYYKDKEHYEDIYTQRFNSEIAVHFNFTINGNQVFFLETPDLLKKVIDIERIDKDVRTMAQQLPNLSIEQFTRRCLIDEIVLSNNIEGVHSTRKEIDDVLRDLKTQDRQMRFKGLVNKYNLLISNEELKIDSSKDIRNIYDELVLPEVIETDPDNKPDGKIFRADSVSVTSPTGKEIHKGVYPEDKIIKYMDKAIDILHDNSVLDIFRISAFHYFFGYIHPFYDGNGRTSRFISSYLLSKYLEPIIGYRISYTIQEYINQYYEAFKICNSTQNKGDITPFMYMFADVVRTSMLQLQEALSKRLNALDYYSKAVYYLPKGTNNKFSDIYFLLVQASLFSENGISIKELVENTSNSKTTISNRLNFIKENNLLEHKIVSREKYYWLNLDIVDKIIKDNK